MIDKIGKTIMYNNWNFNKESCFIAIIIFIVCPMISSDNYINNGEARIINIALFQHRFSEATVYNTLKTDDPKAEKYNEIIGHNYDLIRKSVGFYINLYDTHKFNFKFSVKTKFQFQTFFYDYSTYDGLLNARNSFCKNVEHFKIGLIIMALPYRASSERLGVEHFIKSLAIKLRIPILDLYGDPSHDTDIDRGIFNLEANTEAIIDSRKGMKKRYDDQNQLKPSDLVIKFTESRDRMATFATKYIIEALQVPNLALWYTSDYGECFLDSILHFIQHFSEPQREFLLFWMDRSNPEHWSQYIKRTKTNQSIRHVAIFCPIHNECETIVELIFDNDMHLTHHFFFLSPNAYVELLEQTIGISSDTKLKQNFYKLNATIWLPHNRASEEFEKIEQLWRYYCEEVNRNQKKNTGLAGEEWVKVIPVHEQRMSEITTHIYDGLSAYMLALERLDQQILQWVA